MQEHWSPSVYDGFFIWVVRLPIAKTNTLDCGFVHCGVAFLGLFVHGYKRQISLLCCIALRALWSLSVVAPCTVATTFAILLVDFCTPFLAALAYTPI